MSKLLRVLGLIDLLLCPVMLILPRLPWEQRFSMTCMCLLIAINAICVSNLIDFLDRLCRRLGLP